MDSHSFPFASNPNFKFLFYFLLDSSCIRILSNPTSILPQAKSLGQITKITTPYPKRLVSSTDHQKNKNLQLLLQVFHQGGYRDSNPGPPEPQSGALTNCAIATITYEFGTEVPNEPEGIRTPDPRLRRPLLYPAELRTHKAGDGNRTHVSSLEGWCSTIELHPRVDDREASFPSSKFEVSVSIDLSPLIGVTGFEPATSWSQTRRSSQAEPHPASHNRLAKIRFHRNARRII